jgi:hypothetical protein
MAWKPHTYEVKTRPFGFPITGNDGRQFLFMEEIFATVEIYADEDIHCVVNIFTEEYERTVGNIRVTRCVYLGKDHPLYPMIEAFILSSNDLISEDWREDFRPDQYDRADADYAAHE